MDKLVLQQTFKPINQTIMAQNQLKFRKTWTQEEFKTFFNLSEAPIRKRRVNEAGEEKFFMQFSTGDGTIQTGPITRNYASIARTGKDLNGVALDAKPMISEVEGDPTEQNPTGVFFMMHQYGEGGAEVW